MGTIAVVQNGTDVSRSSWADVADCFREAARLISDEVTVVSVDFYADDEANHLFASLDSDLKCIIFATNSLTSERVRRAVSRHTARIHEFIENGGGLILLHQWLDSLSVVLPEPFCPAMATRTSDAPNPTPVDKAGRDDILLHFPFQTPMDRLRDGGSEFGPSWLFFKALDRAKLPDALKPVLVRDDHEAVLVRTDDHEPRRIIICTPLLDWQHNVPLLANLMRWAAYGSPTRLVRIGDNSAPEKLLHWWLSMDGCAAVSRVPIDGNTLTEAERWLLTDRESQVEAFVIPPENLEPMYKSPEVLRFLERGGAMLTTGVATELPATRITAYVGDYTKRELARGLYASLRSVSNWDSVESAFDLRNVTAAVVLLWSDDHNQTAGAISPTELKGQVPEIFRRLSTPRHQEDVSSSIALAQIIALLQVSADSKLDLIDSMFQRPLAQQFDVQLQLRALRLAWSRRPDPAYLSEVLAALNKAAPELTGIAPVIRVLDSIALLRQLRLLIGVPSDIALLAHLMADLFDRFPPQPGLGWNSSEATADVVRGLLAILELLAANDDGVARRLAEQAVFGADVILHELAKREDASVREVAWRARLTHALVLADDYFPVGLQRLTSLRWPETSAVADVISPTQRSLIEHLATENKRVRGLKAQVEAADAEKARQLANDALASRLGRALATWLPTAGLIGGGVAIAVAVGSSSFWGLLANVGVLLSALLTLLTLLFAGLDSLNLLSASASILHRGLKNVAEPVLASLGKLKGR